jgi:CRISPR-associated protein Csh2
MSSINRTAIYFAYEGRNNNPNGDPAGENKPRVYNQKNVYVTDVSSKRDDRDYLNQMLPEAVFLKQKTKTDGHVMQMDDLIKEALEQYQKLNHNEKAAFFVNRYIDIKFFGATLTGNEKKGTKKGNNKGELASDSDDKATLKESICGPIQKTFGMSLNYPEVIPVKITTVLATKEDSTGTGSMGTKYICDYYHVHYDVIVNPAALTDWNAELTEDDFRVFETTQWFSMKNDITHSKVNREPILMLEIVFSDPDYYFLPSNYVVAKNHRGKSYAELDVDYANLIKQIISNKDHITEVKYILNPVYEDFLNKNLLNEISNIVKTNRIILIDREKIKAHLNSYTQYVPG